MKEEHIFILDNASSHSKKKTNKYMNKIGFKDIAYADLKLVHSENSRR